MKWIRYNQDLPMRWAFKKDVPKCWQHWARQVQFTWEKAWIVLDHESCVYMLTGEWAKTCTFFLKTPGHVIGLRDLTTADANDWANEWREALHDRIVDSIKS